MNDQQPPGSVYVPRATPAVVPPAFLASTGILIPALLAAGPPAASGLAPASVAARKEYSGT